MRAIGCGGPACRAGMTRAIVVMGVSGCGKSTLACALAEALGWRFVEGDALHPPANRVKMAAGMPLDDADRAPFLDAVAAALAGDGGSGAVAACSALKHAYRERIRIRMRVEEVRFVLPLLDRAALAQRLATRRGHFMPAALLDSQLATLELPAPGEHAILLDGASPVAAQVATVLQALTPRAGARS